MFNGHGVDAPLKLLLKEVVSNAPRNEGERGKGTEVGEVGQEGKSELGLETNFGEGGSGKIYAAISGGISRSGVTGRLIGTDGKVVSRVDGGKCGIATAARDDGMGSRAGCAFELRAAESADSDNDNWITGVSGLEIFSPALKLFTLCS